ncbi:MAG: DUF4251 domain-containing protein [Bacteroidales bacterium]|jgi:hypothetical protein|nr:DUF4251 domain-containing protein [Bacteroidales bacterium]
MKKMGILILLLFFAVGSNILYGQGKKSKKQRKAEQTEMIKQLIENQNYVFKRTPPPVTDPGYPTIYEVIVTKEEVIGILPFFGARFESEKNPEIGNRFKNKDFDYKVENAKNGGWNIYIKTEVRQGLYDMTLKVSPSGMATLMLRDPVREWTVTYRGDIQQII